MIKNELYYKVMRSNLSYTLNKLGYVFFTNGYYNLNIIGIRKDNNQKITNKFDDILAVRYRTPQGWQTDCFNITTEPGDYYMRKNLGNPKGTAILVPGQYRATWKLDLHRGKYEALCQRKPVKVYRDGNKDDIYDLVPEEIHEGLFGINIHRSNKGFTRETVDQYSAGCQVFANPKDFDKFIALCKKQERIYGNSFTYTLIDEKDLQQ